MDDFAAPSSGWKPVPDPTVLSVELIDREIRHAKELTASEILHARQLSDAEVRHARELSDLRAELAERQRLETKADTEKALAAALAAQKEQAGVLAVFTADQLKTLGTSFSSSNDQIRRDIGELKESNRERGGEQAGGAANRAAMIAVVGLVATLIGIGSFVFGANRNPAPAPAPVVVTVPVPAQ